MSNHASDGNPSHRQRYLAVFASLAATVIVMIGCATPPPGSLQVVRETVVVEKNVVVTPTSAPAQDITMRAAHYGKWETFNPLTIFGGNMTDTAQRVFSPLVAYDLNYKAFADLAESWSVSEDGNTYTFKLRPNAKWHDGEPFTAKDVVFTFGLAANPATGSVYASTLEPIKGLKDFSDGKADSIAGITAVDDQTVTIELNEPDAYFLPALTKIFMLPEHLLANIKPEELPQSDFMLKSPVGTGPYKLVGFDPVNEVVDYEAYQDYHWGAPKIKNVKWVWIAKPDAETVALEKGDIEYAPWNVWNEDHYKQAIAAPNINSIPRPYAFVGGLIINTAKPYFADKRVRQAMFQAIDRRQFASPSGYDKMYKGYYDLAPWAKNPEVDFSQMYPYDPEAAKKLLEEAGWDPNQEVVLYTTVAGADPTRLAIQQMLGDIGMKVRIEQVETTVTDKAVNQDRPPTYDLYTTGFPLDDPGLGTSTVLKCESPGNFFGYCNPELDKLFVSDRTATSLEERAQILQQIEKMMVDDPVMIPLTYAPQYVGFSTKCDIPRYSWYTFPYMQDWSCAP